MKNIQTGKKISFRILLVIAVLLFSSGLLFCQQILDHGIFLEKIRHSSEDVYKECIKEYDAYLDKYPDDVSVWIEKCKFIRYAAYNEEEDYNPHQAEFDNCVNILADRFPDDPKVLLFRTTYEWGDDLEDVFMDAEDLIDTNPELWDPATLAELYKAMADFYYYDSDYSEALIYAGKALSNDRQYGSSIEYARILLELDKKQEALNALLSSQDTTQEVWKLIQKANMLLQLKAYPEALALYNRIAQIDSTYNNNANLASTLEGIGEYELARKYWVADTLKGYDKKGAFRSLLMHDLRYQDGPTCIATYNAFRDLGYSSDPIGLYRIKLFLSHPGQPWKFRDLSGILSLLLVILILVIIPYIWILPVPFIGRYSKFLSSKQAYESHWGLKMFWIASAGYLLASLFSGIVDPGPLYSLFSSSGFGTPEMSIRDQGLEALVFMLILTLVGLLAMYKVNPKVLLSSSWSLRQSVLAGAGIVFVFKIVSAVYMQLGVLVFDISINDLMNIPKTVLAAKQDIAALISTYGKGTAFLMIGFIAPVYEEIIFRGVLLDSCQRYLNFHVANVFQALLFSLIHQSLFLIPVFLLFGILAGIVRKKSGGLLPGIVFHVLNNTLTLLVI